MKEDESKVEFEEMYDKVKAWRDQFDGFAKEGRSPQQYYEGMASGLNIALQEIDRERYDREERP